MRHSLKLPVAILGPGEFDVLELRGFDADLEIESGDLGTRRAVGEIHDPAVEIAGDGDLGNEDLFVEQVVRGGGAEEPVGRKRKVQVYRRPEIAHGRARRREALRVT